MSEIKGPWGRGSRPTGGGNNGSGRPPENNNPLEKALREAQQKWRGHVGGGNSGNDFNERKAIGLILSALLLLWVASGVYRVNSDELGVVMRFGKYQRTAPPGLNYHLPFPVEQVIIPSVTTVNKVEIGYRGNGGAENPNVRVARMSLASKSDASNQNPEGLMLTGDRNIVDIDFEVQWKIDSANPQKFLFNMRDPAGNVRAVAESAMREVIGRSKLDDVLTGAQSQIAEDTKTLMQQMFDDYDAGIEIIAVNLSRPDVPQPVIGEFQDVKRAEQDKQTAESVAEGYRNEILPRAKGDAAKMLEDAQAYKSRVIADAEGDASRFKQIYTQYAQAKDVTKKRMYLETMETVLRGMPKVIVDNSGKNGALPVLPLNIPAAQPQPLTRSAPAVSVAPATTTTGQ